MIVVILNYGRPLAHLKLFDKINCLCIQCGNARNCSIYCMTYLHVVVRRCAAIFGLHSTLVTFFVVLRLPLYANTARHQLVSLWVPILCVWAHVGLFLENRTIKRLYILMDTLNRINWSQLAHPNKAYFVQMMQLTFMSLFGTSSLLCSVLITSGCASRLRQAAGLASFDGALAGCVKPPSSLNRLVLSKLAKLRFRASFCSRGLTAIWT